MRKLLIVVLTLASALIARPGHAEDRLWLEPPVPLDVAKKFDPGVSRYSAGHRGVDLRSAAGAEIRAAADGVVTFAGYVAGRPSVSVTHRGTLRTTYTPVVARVTVGQTVRAGEVIGTLDSSQHCYPEHCLHWGLTDGVDYFDPLSHVVGSTPKIRLVPLGTQPSPPAGLPHARGMPVEGPITSPFGMRVHPVTGIYKLHDGVDIGAACGTPIRVPWSGRVVSVQSERGYGLRVIVEHGSRRSAYAHLQKSHVRVGQQVTAQTVLGEVGNTGWSTGCHLHWMIWENGRLVNPLTVVSSP